MYPELPTKPDCYYSKLKRTLQHDPLMRTNKSWARNHEDK